MKWVEALAVLTYLVLLAASLFMLVSFYICDNQNCKAFNDAAKQGEPGTKDYVLGLSTGTFGDGIWPIPYIGSTIGTIIELWFVQIPFTIRNFCLLFFINFIIIYFMFVFFGHHFVKPINNYIYTYIEDNCPGE